MKSNILFIHGGGPTAVLNSSLWGVINEAGHYGELEHLYAAVGGTGGFLREQLIDLRDVSEDDLTHLLYTPGSAIGTSRDALGPEDYKRMAALAQKYNIKYIVMNGGTPEKPVGTVWIAISTADGDRARLLQLSSMRERAYLRTLAANQAIAQIFDI